MIVPREETMSLGYRELNISDPLSEITTISSPNDSGHGWSVGSAGHYEKLPDLCRYETDQTWKQCNQQMINKPRGDNYDSYHWQPDVDINTSCHSDPMAFIINCTSSKITDYPQPNVAMTNSCNSIGKPVALPCVPVERTLPKIPSQL
ncbi:hypothetical protein Ahia01_000723600 [Argonauta hians]